MIKNEQERQRIGQDIAQLRKEKGMTQQNVADRADIMRPHIARVELGKYNFGFDTLQAIADALDADIRIVPRQK
jgi:transcriptional regulator with XRE-family HTH domain